MTVWNVAGAALLSNSLQGAIGLILLVLSVSVTVTSLFCLVLLSLHRIITYDHFPEYMFSEFSLSFIFDRVQR